MLSDNSWLNEKIKLRKKFLIENPCVLDLYCGTGKMYFNVYKETALKYIGIDKEKIFDDDKCFLSDNEEFVRKNNIKDFNVFDLDAYGTPWFLFEKIIKKASRQELHFFVTDGLFNDLHHSWGAKTKIFLETEGVEYGTKIFGVWVFYPDFILNFLKQTLNRYGRRLTKAVSLKNSRNKVCYWYLKLK